MDEVVVARYWCYMCSQMVNPNMEAEIKCPFCHSGFVEEMAGRGDADITDHVGFDQSPSIGRPIMLGMISTDASRPRRYQRHEQGDESNQDHESVTIFRRRRRNSAIFRLIQDLEDRIQSNSENIDGERESGNAIVLQALFGNQNQGQDSDNTVGGLSLGDYFPSSGLDILLQHLAENDPNRYGTPPARKEAVNALPIVKVQESTSCSICLEDFVVDTEAKEMPCKHFFHSECILQWLELHCSCPVCRFELPAEESQESGGSSNVNRPEGNADDGNASRSRFLVNVPWSFNELFPASQYYSENPSDSSSESNAYADNN
ncbi:RNA polymerase archaeal subunit P/eukaryotic subunit RPABC4 protein [Dioscorea alata]|uniref:RNA polymerase archaeal subunit P/eukaryotic subunit RPABC4 protein n=1 Tax=Dioscorea alata TaxID=55571 RepID=A0ACB7VF41_DIOAL|nr:RNA polymerase archaeal subunit P/eukaryotic subunit RPABC4 protein [Dioscorea alata]